MSESFAELPDILFVEAMLDPKMTMPDGVTPLFSSVFSIRTGADASITGSGTTLVLPLRQIIISIGLPYGSAQSYSGAETTQTMSLRINFTVWGNTEADQQETLRRLEFARDSRSYVFSGYGLSIKGGTINARRRPYQPVDGLVATDYGWHFFYDRSHGTP